MLVTLAAARLHVKVVDENQNADVLMKLEQAEAMILDYLARSTDATWTATMATWGTEVGSPAVVIPAPAVVQAAILEQLAELYAYRGDDPEVPTRGAAGELSPSIKNKLYRWRLPVLA